jgi:hypothetical protein
VDWLSGLKGHIQRRLAALTVSGVWSLLVLGALLSTLSSLRNDDFDGTNNILQLPLALPWNVIAGFVQLPVRQNTHWAYLDACFGWLNGALMYAVVRRQDRSLDDLKRAPAPPDHK